MIVTWCAFCVPEALIPSSIAIASLLIIYILLTPKWVDHFFKNVILFCNVVYHKCDIFYMTLVQYNEYLVSIMDTDGLVL